MTQNRLKRMVQCIRASHIAGGMLATIVLSFASPALAVDDPWEPGTNWLSFRIGYSKLAAENAPNGGAGYGFGVNHLLHTWGPFNGFAVGGYVHHEVRGRRGPATLIDIPFTFELTKHFAWEGELRPYAGLGYGAYFVKAYRVPVESTSVRGGFHVTTGVNTRVSNHSILGVDFAAGTVTDTDEEVRWGIKLNYSWAY